ncbi:MAG: sulfur carrier protein ThiS [Deferribacterales bacterium]|nr:sulfur carrier protein ThiS [Deferribacterales bacterium]
MTEITVTVNGKPLTIKEGSSIADAAKNMGVWEQSIVAELDGEILSKDEMENKLLKNGSNLELIRFVGGG